MLGLLRKLHQIHVQLKLEGDTVCCKVRLFSLNQVSMARQMNQWSLKLVAYQNNEDTLESKAS